MAASSNDDNHNILNILHWSAKEGTLLASCEPEVKELMHQIDILLSNQSSAHTNEISSLKNQLQSRDKELSSLRLAVHEKTIQADKLRSELAQSKKELKVRNSDHETQLLRLRTELNRLNKCYEKLKSRKLRSSVGGVQKSESDDKTSFIEVLERRCESYLEQIDDQKETIEQLRNIQEELTAKYLESQREMVRLECEVQKGQSRKGLEEELVAKDKKIASLKKERDLARSQTKDSLAESEKWYNQSMRLSILHKESESHVSDIVRQLNELHQSVKSDESVRIHEIVELKRCLAEKDNIIRDLTNEKIVKYKSDTHNELETLQATVQRLRVDEKKWRDENNKLKKRLEEKTLLVQNELKSELDKRETELHENRIKLLKRETQLQTYCERINHLEELLSVATEHANSSHETSHEKSHDLPLGSHDRSHDLPLGSHDRSHDLPLGSHDPGSTVILNEFQDKLSSIMRTHFTNIDKSLQNALITEN